MNNQVNLKQIVSGQKKSYRSVHCQRQSFGLRSVDPQDFFWQSNRYNRQLQSQGTSQIKQLDPKITLLLKLMHLKNKSNQKHKQKKYQAKTLSLRPINQQYKKKNNFKALANPIIDDEYIRKKKIQLSKFTRIKALKNSRKKFRAESYASSFYQSLQAQDLTNRKLNKKEGFSLYIQGRKSKSQAIKIQRNNKKLIKINKKEVIKKNDQKNYTEQLPKSTKDQKKEQKITKFPKNNLRKYEKSLNPWSTINAVSLLASELQ